MINLINPLHVVLNRLAYADLAKGAFFFWDEVKNWPSEALNLMVEHGFLKPAPPMTTLECDGCAENCIMPVTIYPTEEVKPGRAFINCDKRDDIGRVKVDFRRLTQWFVSGELIAKAVVDLLELEQSPTRSTIEGQWLLGMLKGTKFHYPLTLRINGTAALMVAGHAVQLLDLLSIKANILTLDRVMLLRLVNNPADSNVTESSDARRKRLIKRVGEERAKGTKAFLKVVAGEENISISRLKQLISNVKHSEENIPSTSSMLDRQTSSKKSKPKE